MGKNKQRKRSRSASTGTVKSTANESAWKPVSVTLPGERSNDDTTAADTHPIVMDPDQDEKQLSRNHYDDPKLSRKAAKDLQMNPGEDCVMFYGLEVLDASQYQVVGKGNNKRLIITGGDGRGADAEDEKNSSAKAQSNKAESPNEVPLKKKRKKDKMQSKDDGEAEKEQKGTEKSTLKKRIDDSGSDNNAVDDSEHTEPSKKSKKKKKKKSKKENVDEQEPEEGEAADTQKQEAIPLTPDQLAKIRSSWSESSGGAHIHNRLLESLHRLGFEGPTPIQSATLAAAIMGRRNLVGAAPTGSGKTLAFLIPILNHILEQKSETDDTDNVDQQNSHVQALIMTPTRELATQIHAECDKLLPNQCVTLVGGIALVKQARLLKTKKPPIVVATPGRLWAMLSSGEHEHLRDLSKIRFLVLDEADRMTQEHSFPQLIKILDAIHAANPRDGDDDDEADDSESDDEDGDRLLGLPGVRGEAQLTMLTDDILQGIEAQKGSTEAESKEVPDEEYPEVDSDDEDGMSEGSIDDAFAQVEKVHRQTFIYSATLTLPFTSTKTQTNSKVAQKRKKLGLDGGIAEILEKTRAMGETKVVDLSSSSPVKAQDGTRAKNGVRLPPGLSLEQIKCTQMHKDSHLYAYLMTTEQGASGPCLVFCNSIAAVRRVGATLTALGFTVRILHAHMQQRARFKAVESLKASKTRTVVVSTDVAARGLDIPSVSTVVHYDVARAVDTFVHRSGRTARGIGAGAVGSSLSLISPAEDKAHSKIVQSVGVTFHKILLDGRLLTSSQERTNLASKIITAEEMQQKTNSSNKWFLEKAKEAELELDDDLMEDESNRPEKEQQQLLEAKRARVRLAQLLDEPMKKQKYGKFLSTNSEAAQNGLTKTLLKRAA